MSDLPVGLKIAAVLRQLDQQSIPYYSLQKGNDQSGTILFSMLQASGQVILYGQQRNAQYKLVFMPLHKEESLAPAQADEYIRRALARDPDLWVIEIEARNLKTNFFDEF